MKEMKRILSLVLCAVMLIGYIPTSALAAEGEAVTEPAATEVVVETTEAVVETTEAVVETTEAIIETTETVVETTEEVVETTEETVPETTPVVKPVMMGMMVSKKEATGEGTDNNAAETTTGSKTDTDYLFIATDRHANTSVIGNIINNMETVIGENELDYLGLGGDMVGSGNTHPAYNSSTVLGEVTGATSSLSAVNVDIVAGIHDMNVTDDAGIVLPYQKGGAQIYEGTKFYVYGVEEYCISDDSNESNWSAQAQAFVDWANGDDIDKAKAIIVLSHYPLHAKRDDNDGAYYWHQALNTVATGSATGTEVSRDIVFFHGHNHTKDSNEYVYNVGDTMSIQNGSSTVSEAIYYTYATAGYLNQNSKATLVTITKDAIALTKYGTSGSGTAMATVERVQEIDYILINEGNGAAYAIGETPLFQLLVNYTDGTSETVDQSVCEITAVTTVPNGEAIALETALQTVGEYSATVTYQGVEATTKLTFTVNEKGDFEDGTSYDTLSLVISGATLTADVVKNVTTEVAEAVAAIEGIVDYVAYDISATLEEGQTAQVSIPVPEEWEVGELSVYYIDNDGNVTDEEFVVEYTDGFAVFDVTHFSTYVVGNSTATGEDKDATVEGTEGVNITAYVRVDGLTAGKEYLIVNSNTAGSAYAMGNSTTGASVTVNAATDVITNPYITNIGDALVWTASSGWGFESGSYNLGVAVTGGMFNRTFTLSTSTDSDWSYSNNRLSYTYSIYTHYLTCSSDGVWSVQNSDSNVYFYEKQTVTTGTQTATYGIDITLDGTATQGITAAFVQADETKQLGFAFTSTVEGQSPASGGTYEWTSSNADVATVDENGLVTFEGVEGKTLIQVSYTWTENGQSYTISNYVSIDVTTAIYHVEISQDGTTAAPDIIAQRNVQSGTTLELKALPTVQTDESTTAAATPDTTTWYVYLEDGSAATSIASIDQNGKLTFTGAEGTIKVMVACKFGETTVNDIITVHVRKSNAVTPEESTTDFPRWPNEGAVRYDKTAQAIGNFSNTGVAQVELSLAGIPQKTGGAVDVVIMLDMTGSMSDEAMAAAEESAIAFAEQIVKKDDGTYTNSRIAILAFNSGSNSPYTYWELGTVDNDSEWTSLCSKVRGASSNQVSGGTPYDEALEKCQSILEAAKKDGTGNDRQQFCVFVSDGGPTSYEYITNYDAVKAGTADEYTTSTASASGGANQKDSNFATIATYTHEYYSTMMKDDGVTMYSVLTGLVAANYPNCTTIMKNIATDAAKAYVVEDGEDTDAITNAFTAIAEEIKQAASQIEVSDKITDEYEMIFQWPEKVDEDHKVSGQEFYIEVVNYELDATTHERNGTYDVLTRVYLTEATDGTLSISKLVKIDDVNASSDGTTTELTTTPAYTAVEEGKKGYFNLVDGKYEFVADGTGAYNMTAGATVSGNADTVKLHTPYFSYDASTKVITWHITETAENSEIALRYFLYLTGSLESVENKLEEGDEGYVAPGTYPTNDYATLEYKNFKGNDCLQYFPEPQLTWNGAQVSYVFYLVDKDTGKPVNTAGREVQFSEAVFVTSIHTEAVVWNEEQGKTSLNATKVAEKLLPTDYTLYDPTTQYEINVYMDEKANNLGNHFIITAGGGTTKVYNTKAGTKYSTPGTYNANNVETGFDFANTTVAFAVVWEKKLVADTVVVDYGLPVDIDVATNDFVYNSLTAIGTNAPDVEINTGVYEASALNTKVDTTTGMSAELALGAHKAQVLNEKVVRFTPGSMEFNVPVTFNYETATDFYENSKVETGYMYSSVTVIPATTVYYEDSFLTLESYTNDVKDDPTKWTREGATVSATQAQDRPGESQISDALDADNNYGYDAAYSSMSTHSLGSAAKITVSEAAYGTAEFTFYGTGFDVISLTSNATGTITVLVKDGNNNIVKNTLVDTYYGMNADGTINKNETDPLYQVPVIKIFGLDYGKYTVKITAAWNDFFDHIDGSTSYDLYLDAIRIYDPAGVTYGDNGNIDDVIQDAYLADGEADPVYFEVRNQIITAATFDSLTTDDVAGVVFIDCNDGTSDIAEYTSYGPNNEVYLAAGQAIAFELNASVDVGDLKVQLALKSVGGTASAKVYAVGGDVALDDDITTATDMYYDITKLNGKTVVIMNDGADGILSITNVKVTSTMTPEEDTGETVDIFRISKSSANAALATMNIAEEPEVPETSEPVVEETEAPETSAPESSEPETSEPEETEPEETKPESTQSKLEQALAKAAEQAAKVAQNVKKAAEKAAAEAAKAISKLFSRWF